MPVTVPQPPCALPVVHCGGMRRGGRYQQVRIGALECKGGDAGGRKTVAVAAVPQYRSQRGHLRIIQGLGFRIYGVG